MEVGKLPLTARRMIKSQETSGKVHLVAVITGLDREERRDDGRPNAAGCGRLAEVGVGSVQGMGWVCRGTETRRLRRLHHLPPQPCPSTFHSLPWVSFSIFFPSLPEIPLSIFPHQLQMACKDQNKSSWGLLMSNSLCFASSFGFSDLYYVWEPARNTPEITPETRLRRLGNRGWDVHYPQTFQRGSGRKCFRLWGTCSLLQPLSSAPLVPKRL